MASWGTAEVESEDLYPTRGGAVDIDGKRVSLYLQRSTRVSRSSKEYYLNIEARLPAVNCPKVSIRRKGLVTFILWAIGRRISLSPTKKVHPARWAVTECDEQARQRGALLDPKFIALVDLIVSQGWREINFYSTLLRLQKPLFLHPHLPTSSEISAILKASAELEKR
jgi:hypothetical protein